MRRRTPLLLLALLVLGGISLGIAGIIATQRRSDDRQRYDRIQPGMTEAEVFAILGPVSGEMRDDVPAKDHRPPPRSSRVRKWDSWEWDRRRPSPRHYSIWIYFDPAGRVVDTEFQYHAGPALGAYERR